MCYLLWTFYSVLLIHLLILFIFFWIFFKFYFIFKLYITVLVLPNIKMNPPQVYMCSPSWTLLPPPSLILFKNSFIYFLVFVSMHWVLIAACRLSSCLQVCRILVLWPGIEPESPALQGRFLTIGPPGKSLFVYSCHTILSYCDICLTI